LSPPPFLQFAGVSKHFDGVLALDGVSFDVARGEVHAVMGENGAGKSTLMKILAGALRRDAGEIRLDGRPEAIPTPLDAHRLGIGIVHQEALVCDNLTVAENLFLGRPELSRGWRPVRFGPLRERARELFARLEHPIDPDAPVGTLSVALKQLVQIARALACDARLLILDEPTASLSDHEADVLFRILRGLRERGITILYVSHRLPEIRALADRATVLRDGRFVGTARVAETAAAELVRMMVGRDVEFEPVRTAPPAAAPRLEVEGLSRAGVFEDISFAVRPGEIVGCFGLVGSGRTEAARAVFGLDPFDRGTVRLDGHPVRIRSPRHAVSLGIGLLPEDRKGQGAILGMALGKNVTLAALPQLAPAGWIRGGPERETVDGAIERLRIRTAGPAQEVRELSGGNQQKAVLAKWLAIRPGVLILDEPTKGIDIGAKTEIHRLIGELSAQGIAVLLISSELPEVLAVAHRILVFHEGRIVRELARGEADEENVMRHATRTVEEAGTGESGRTAGSEGAGAGAVKSQIPNPKSQ
jgi:ABC-type sugar transport system ATPase subunit